MRIQRYLVCSLIVFLFSAVVFAAVGDPRLDEARDLFRQGSEETSRRASIICREVNTVEAAELMLEILKSTGMGPGLPSGHYRDIVWEEMGKLTDPYAKARIELELKKNKDSPWVRAWTAELLGIYGDQEYTRTLTKALKDKDPRVRASAAEALGRLVFPDKNQATEKAVLALTKVTSGKHPFERTNALIALMKLAPEDWTQKYILATEGRAADKDGGVRCALLGALPELAPGQVEAVSARALDDEDWRVRLQAVNHLAAARSKTAIDRLIDATEDERPTIRLRAMDYLRELTGQGHRQTQGWRAWWKNSRATFTFPEGSAKGQKPTSEGETVATYNGIRVDSDHVAFLIDKSSAMREQLVSQGKSKEMFAQAQLEEVLGKLPEGVTFNVYTYELDVEVFSEKGPLELTKKSKKKALDFVKDQRTKASKDIWQVLEMVVSDPHIDTIYLLSSGEPDTGKYVHWNRVTAHLQDINRYQMVTVHTIAYSDNGWYREQMEKIAQATGGEFKWFE